MGILDGIVEWIAEQVMNGLDLVTTSVLGALGCDMAVFLRYFPAAGTMYQIFVALAIGIILLNWIWQLFKNFGLGAGIEAEDPVKLSIRSVLFIVLAYFSDDIVNTVNNFMSCHRFNLTCCRKITHFPVTQSIVYTTIYFQSTAALRTAFSMFLSYIV